MRFTRTFTRRATFGMLAGFALAGGCQSAGLRDARGPTRVAYQADNAPARRSDDSELRDGELRYTPRTAWSATLIERCRALEPLLREAALRHRVDPGLIAGIIRVESGFRASARSGAGATGLMQVMPRTGERLGCTNLDEPKTNIECGVRVLNGFLRSFRGELIYGLSGYNAGTKRPKRAREGQTLPSNAAYVERVLAERAVYLRDGCGP